MLLLMFRLERFSQTMFMINRGPYLGKTSNGNERMEKYLIFKFYDESFIGNIYYQFSICTKTSLPQAKTGQVLINLL